MRYAVFSVLLAGLLFAGLPAVVHAQLDCTDFLTFNYNGYIKTPLDASDYNTSIRGMRVISGRVDGFHFPSNVSQNYFYGVLSREPRQDFAPGTVVFQYTPGVSDYYYRDFNAAIPWYCDGGKMADLAVSYAYLNGTFYTLKGAVINASSVPVLVLDSGVEDGFWVPSFGTSRKVLVSAEDNVTALPPGFAIHDAGNGTFISTGFKQVRLHIPANATPFCGDLGEFCVDQSGTHYPVCQGRSSANFVCKSDACVANVTSCKFGCESGACRESAPTPSPTAAPTATVAPTATATAAPSATAPAQTGGGMGGLELLVPLLVLIAAGYYLLGNKRRPKGL